MTPQRWQRVKASLADALECERPEEREAIVQRACAGDRLLKQELNSLLAYADDGIADKPLPRLRVTPK